MQRRLKSQRRGINRLAITAQITRKTAALACAVALYPTWASGHNMAKKIKIVDLEKEIESLLEEYGDNVAAVTKASGEAVAKKTVQLLKTTGDYEDRTGKYRKSFRYKTESNYAGSISTVYSAAPHYRLTHLLEHGHAINGGSSRTKAFPHWKPAEEKANQEFEDTLVREIEKIK